MTSTPPSYSLLDSIRRTIEQRNLFSARTRVKFVSAFEKANNADEENRTKNGRNFRSPLSAIPAMETRHARLRNKVTEEIINTEEIYVNFLRTIRDEFMEDSEIKMSFSKRDFTAIFSNIPSLLAVNEKLLEDLQNSPSVKSVAESFLNYTPYLKLYSTYASGFQQGHNLLVANMNQNLMLRSLIKAKEEKLNNTLQSYLITPIQRIPRYKLLLEQLVGYYGLSSRRDGNLKSIIESIKNLDQVAQHMNEMIAQHEKSCKLVELNSWMGKYPGDLVQPGRTFIKSDTVTKVHPPSIIPTQLVNSCQFFLILLSDQILWCKIKGELGTRGCLQPMLVLPLKRTFATLLDNDIAEITCETESVKFTMANPEEVSDWVLKINESSQNLKRRSATLKKPSSNARPMRRQQIRNVIRDQKKQQQQASRGVKRSLSMTSLDPNPAPSPGKLRRFFNIPEKLNEIVERLSPRKSQSPRRSLTMSPGPGRPKKKKVPGRSMSYRERLDRMCFEDEIQPPKKSRAAELFTPATRLVPNSCSIV